MPRLTYTDPTTKELRYVRPENIGSDQFQMIDGWSSSRIKSIAGQRSWSDTDKQELRELMFRAAPGEIKGVVERASFETIVKWATDGGFYFSRVTPQLDEERCAPSGDENFGQMPPELAVQKHRRYPHVLDIHRGTDPQLPAGKQWIVMIRDVIAHGQSLQKGVRDRVDVVLRRGKLSGNDPATLFEVQRTDVFDDFYQFIRLAGIPHHKSGNYLTIPLLTLEQWAQANSLIISPDTNPPTCDVESERKTLMNIEGKMSFDDVTSQLNDLFEMVRTASTPKEMTAANKGIKAFEKKIGPYKQIYDKGEVKQIEQALSSIQTLVLTRTQVLTQ
jgi:hypothetical protein